MVAQKKGRGAKAQPAKAKPVQPAEEPAPEAEMAETQEAEENNGDVEQPEQADEAAGGDTAEGGAEQEAEQVSEADAQAKPEEKKEEKVESGKLLVENLPSSFLFDYQEKLKELFSKYGEITNVKRGPIIVTELTTTPTLSAIVEFKNKDSLEKALTEEGTLLDGRAISVAVESRAETAVLVGVPYEASTDYVRMLFGQCGPVAHIHEFSKTKYKILRVTFHEKECVEKALKLDRELRINGFLVTVSKYRDEDEQKAHSANVNKNKRQHPTQQGRNNAGAGAGAAPATPPGAGGRAPPAFRGARGGAAPAFSTRGGNFRGARGRGGFPGRGAFRGGFSPANNYLPPPQPFMGRPNYLM